MKIKELNRPTTACIAWSPKHVNPVYLVCGTSAQQLDASCSSSSALQIYDLSASNTSLDMNMVSAKNTEVKFNKILWAGEEASDHASGIIVGGCSNRSIYVYSAEKLLKNEEEALISSMEGKHVGPVKTLDFNDHQANLLASGSSDCEIIIWDINDTSSPMTPGTKPNMTCDVNEVAWNKQVEHILAATYGGRCVVYDLRKSSPIIQIAESVSRLKAHSVKWHPAVATQLILASDDDSTAMAQVWDLRFATTPLKALPGHQRGIVASAWCPQDADLFITSAKDNKIYVWDPNTKEQQCEIVGKFPTYNQWAFDVAWCKRDPSLVGASSVDGVVSVYSVLGAGIVPTQVNKFSAIADSFPGMEMPAEIPHVSQPQSIYLKRPPKWLAKRCGANFAFGGRLVSFNASEGIVCIEQIVTEPEFVASTARLEGALASDLAAFCQEKAAETTIAQEKTLWNFIGATFSSCVRAAYLSLLGFSPGEVAAKASLLESNIIPEEFEKKLQVRDLNLEPAESEAVSEPQRPLRSTGEAPSAMIRQCLLVGDYDSAVSLCLLEKKASLALIVAAHAGTELYYKTRDSVLQSEKESGLASLVRCVVQHDLHSLVSDSQLSDWKETLVAVLTYASDEELLLLAESLGERLENDDDLDIRYSALMCFLCAGSLDKFVSCLANIRGCSLDGAPAILQEMIETIVVLERALFSLGRTTSLKASSTSSMYLCKYASLLASQGALSTALSYLNNPTQGDMLDLRNRLLKAMNYQTERTRLTSRNRTLSASSQTSLRRSSTPLSYQPSPGVHPMATVSPSFPTSNTAPQVHLTPMPPSLEPMPATRMQHAGLRKPNAAKRYIQEPSGVMEPLAPQSEAIFNPLAHVPQHHVQPNSHFPHTHSASASTAFGSTLGPIPSGPGSPLVHAPDSHEVHGNTMTPAAYDSTLPRGWNDPPSLSAARMTKQRQKSTSGSSIDANATPGPVPMVPEQPQQPAAVKFQGFRQQVPVVNSYAGSEGFIPSSVAPLPPPVDTPAPKGPLPISHQVIQDVFNTLREKGLQATVNPAMKQRLEDLMLKLEVLYDKLRDGTIGVNTVAGLHQIVEAVKCGDYHQALQMHAATISSGNFSEMSQFMPAVKVLLTACMQCQVFYS